MVLLPADPQAPGEGLGDEQAHDVAAGPFIAMDAPTELLAALEPFLERQAPWRGGLGAYR